MEEDAIDVARVPPGAGQSRDCLDLLQVERGAVTVVLVEGLRIVGGSLVKEAVY